MTEDWLIVPLSRAQAEAWRRGEPITLNPAMQDGSIVGPEDQDRGRLMAVGDPGSLPA
jgi:hypothetical protein